MDRAVALYQSTSAPPVFWPFLLMLRSTSLAGVGRVDEAGELADEVMRLIPEDSIVFGEAALNKAEVTLASDAVATEQARELCRRAIKASDAFGLRMTELRACTRLARWPRARRSAPKRQPASDVSTDRSPRASRSRHCRPRPLNWNAWQASDLSAAQSAARSRTRHRPSDGFNLDAAFHGPSHQFAHRAQ